MNLLKSKIFPLLKETQKSLVSILNFLFFWKRNKRNRDRANFDKKIVYSLSKTKIPGFRQIKYINKFLTKKEIWVIRSSFLVILLSLTFLTFNFYRNNLIVGPVVGGDYVEALVGAPNHINPLYSSVNDVDSDIGRLIFSSLFLYDKNGELTKDLVDTYTTSADGKQYIFDIRDNVLWHNGSDLTVDDIVYTFNAIKNPDYESPLRLSFSGVSIEKTGEKQVTFTLSEPYAPFLGLLTFGILPQETWSQIPPTAAKLAELNLKPIGSGPYRFKSLIKDKLGNVRAYKLVLNEDYYGEKPYIENFIFNFFINFAEAINALNTNSVQGISYLPYGSKNDLVARDSLNFHKLNLFQINSIFFNRDTGNKFVKDLAVRKALALAISKEEIVNDVLGGDAVVASGPIVTNSFAFKEPSDKYDFNVEMAKEVLLEAGFKEMEIKEEEIEAINVKKMELQNASGTSEELDSELAAKLDLGVGIWRVKEVKDDDSQYLTVTLTSLDDNASLEVVSRIKEMWEKIGVKVQLNIISLNNFQSNVINSRDFEILYFGQMLGPDPDSYVFWHSAQAGKGGLNISNYANDDVDQLLEDARSSLDKEMRIEKYGKFQDIIALDLPAIFLYSPVYVYVQSKNIKGFDTNSINSPSGRFADVNNWYIKTGKKINWKK